MAMKQLSLRLTDSQRQQLDYLTELYGNQATAFRAAIDLLYILRRLEALGLFDGLDVERLRAALRQDLPADEPG